MHLVARIHTMIAFLNLESWAKSQALVVIALTNLKSK